MQQITKVLLLQYVEDIKKIYGSSLQSVILYGSYARGDYSQESDIDIMILVNLIDQEISQKGHQLSDLTFLPPIVRLAPASCN